MQLEKIYCNVPDTTLDMGNLSTYVKNTDAWLSMSNTMTKLTQTVNESAINMLKLYCGNETVMKFSKLALDDSLNKMLEAYKKAIPNLYDYTAIEKSLLSMSDAFKKVNNDELFKVHKSILKMYEPLKFDTYSLEKTFSELHQRLNEMIQAIPDEDYDVLLKDTEYTKDDVLEDLDVFIQTDINVSNEYSLIWQDDSLSLKQKKDKILEVFYTNHPAIYTIVFICSMLCAIYGCKEMGENFLLPMFENAIVALEGNQDIYFVDVEDGARLYQYADTESDIIMCVNFTEQVEVIDEIKFWSQVIYLDEDGNEIIGWIAKRNLVSYKDWKYEADKMYSDVE